MKGQMKTNDEATVTARQHASPCADCPWSRKSLRGWLGPCTIEEWLDHAHGDGRIECHTLKQADGEFYQCAGSAIYRANICKRPRDPEILILPADRKKVFGFDEFEAHHSK